MKNLSSLAAELGINIDNNDKLKSEKRYTIIVEVIKDKKRHCFHSGNNPYADIKKAIKIVSDQIELEGPSENDIITFRCIEFLYATVPIESYIHDGIKYEMQRIASRWLTPEELKNLKCLV